MYNGGVSFEWDPIKAAANARKHGVQFSEALGVFSDDYAITIKDDESDPSEQRLITLGMGIKGRVLVVVYCNRGENSESSQRVRLEGSNAKSTRRNNEG